MRGSQGLAVHEPSQHARATGKSGVPDTALMVGSKKVVAFP